MNEEEDHQCCTHAAERFIDYEDGWTYPAFVGEECCICGLWTPMVTG